MYPAKAVGGDLYDFIRMPNEKLGIVVGDVFGKGVSAGLFMPAVKIGLRVNVDHAKSIVEILARANRAIYELTDEERFVSLFLRHTRSGIETFVLCERGAPATQIRSRIRRAIRGKDYLP